MKKKLGVIRVLEEDAKLFNGEAKLKGLPQWKLFNNKVRDIDLEKEFKERKKFTLGL